MHNTSREVLPSYQEVRRIQKAFFAAAEEKGLPRRRRELYRSWILGFLYWCSKYPPHRVSRSRIRPFLRAIRSHSDSEPSHEEQATAALNFLFDSVRPYLDRELSLFRTGIFRSEEAAASPRDPSPPDTSLHNTQEPKQTVGNKGDNRGRGNQQEPTNESEDDPRGSPDPGSSKERALNEGAPREKSPKEESRALRLSLSEEQAQRLRQVAGHLELPPELVAERAIELVCSDAGTPQKEPPSKERSLSAGTLLYQNQARIDLFSARNGSTGNAASENFTSQNGRAEAGASEDDKGGVFAGPDATLIK